MSAPLVVNTADGMVWTRRGALRDGEALYAVAGVADCPELVMATLAELAEHVIVGSADVLPVPVGAAPRLLALPWAHAMSDDDLHLFLGDLVSAAMGRWQSDPEVPDRTVLASVEKACAAWRTPGQGSRSDEPEVDALRARVAELEAERHSTNESLSLAAEALREQRDRIAELEALTPAPIQTCRVCGAGYTYGEPCSTCEFRARMAAETQALRERPGEFDEALRHRYRVGHDLPEAGGV